MPEIKILNEGDLRHAVQLDADAVNCIENAFELLATRDVAMPPILSIHIPEYNGELDVKTAYVPGIPSFAVKMSPGFFDNPKLGLPSVNGLMVVFSAKTGLVEAVLLDNGYLTDVRTAAAGAVAAKYLSRQNATVAGIIGAGTQARLQLEALLLVRNIERAIIWSRDQEKAEACAADCDQHLGIETVATSSVNELAAASDIIVTTTPSTVPILNAEHLHAGLHVTAMGSDADYKTELAPEFLMGADRYICDRLAQCRKQGELRGAIEAGLITEDTVLPELGEIVAGRAPGRRSETEITICDLTGMGIQDTAIAAQAMKRSNASQTGTIFLS